MTVAQTARLLRWVIAGLILLGVLLYFFGPTALRTDEAIVCDASGLAVFELIRRHGAIALSICLSSTAGICAVSQSRNERNCSLTY